MDQRIVDILEGHLPDRTCLIKLAEVVADLIDPAYMEDRIASQASDEPVESGDQPATDGNDAVEETTEDTVEEESQDS